MFVVTNDDSSVIRAFYYPPSFCVFFVQNTKTLLSLFDLPRLVPRGALFCFGGAACPLRRGPRGTCSCRGRPALARGRTCCERGDDDAPVKLGDVAHVGLRAGVEGKEELALSAVRFLTAYKCRRGRRRGRVQRSAAFSGYAISRGRTLSGAYPSKNRCRTSAPLGLSDEYIKRFSQLTSVLSLAASGSSGDPPPGR